MNSKRIAFIVMQKIRQYDSCTIERAVEATIRERKLSNVNKNEIYVIIKATLQELEFCQNKIAQ